MQNRFNGQVAVITGGADGLGKAIGSRLGKEGAILHLFDLNQDLLDKTQAEFAQAGITTRSQLVNITNEEQVKSAIEQVVEQDKKLDIMINSAGIVGPNATKIIDTPTDGFRQVLEVNLTGAFIVTKYALQSMEKDGYGRVLLIASIAGKEGNAGMSSYSSSKAGVTGLVKAVGKEYAETNITINGLAPAVIKTALVEQMNPEQVKYMTDKIPMKRCGTLEEVAAIATWIVSAEASFNTGTIFDLSGGRATY